MSVGPGAGVLPARGGARLDLPAGLGPAVPGLREPLRRTALPPPSAGRRPPRRRNGARRLGPSRPESYLAQGTYERTVLRDNIRALATFKAGLEAGAE